MKGVECLLPVPQALSRVDGDPMEEEKGEGTEEEERPADEPVEVQEEKKDERMEEEGRSEGEPEMLASREKVSGAVTPPIVIKRLRGKRIAERVDERRGR